MLLRLDNNECHSAGMPFCRPHGDRACRYGDTIGICQCEKQFTLVVSSNQANLLYLIFIYKSKAKVVLPLHPLCLTIFYEQKHDS